MAPVAWRYSFAKQQLEQDLTDGTIPLDADEMGPQEVYKLEHRALFREYNYVNFRTNLNNLRKLVSEKKVFSISDSDALKSDLKKYPRPPRNHRDEPRWEESAAQKFLKHDVGAAAKDGRRLTVADLYGKNDEYKKFSKRTIQKHIYQEEDSIKFQVYLEYKKEEKKKKKEKKQEKAAEAEAAAAGVDEAAGEEEAAEGS